MSQRLRLFLHRIVLLAGLLLGGLAGWAMATDITLRDGRVLTGKVAMVSSLVEQPKSQPDSTTPQSILLLDDDLRRVFVAKMLVQKVNDQAPSVIRERFLIRQMTMHNGRQVRIVGPIIRITPFDEFGRRTFTMSTTEGATPIIQGITEITPEWTKVEGLRPYIWDMRMATSSIPPATLSKILFHQIKPDDIDQRTKIARFYIQCERYDDAQAELENIQKDFASTAGMKDRIAPVLDRLRQLSAQQRLRELQLRRLSGQHKFVAAALEKFPIEGVGGETLQAVKEVIEADKAIEARRTTIITKLDGLLDKVREPSVREPLMALRAEINKELSANTLPRLAPFAQNMDDEDSPVTDRIALGISGWLLGADNAVTRLSSAISAYRLRKLILEYINEPTRLNRLRSLTGMNSEESASPQLAAAILENMKPPVETPDQGADRPGYYELEVPGQPNQPPSRYIVQLPAEYDPLRRYPTVVTLHGAGTTALNQLDWWAGSPGKNGLRAGQAMRYGYIVVAPLWGAEHQSAYGYSAREHAAVLDCLRDACRRFAVDTDRVFLSGHSMGGDAAWDIGLAHPDLWAGVIPIVARSDKFCALYWENAKLLPFYFISGELDGGKMGANARDIDRYMIHAGFNATVVEYQGRGHEDFYDEVLHLFDWMGRYKRNFYPREFTCSTMRPWDNFFWWLEISGLPPDTIADPANWPRNPHPLHVKGVLTATNGVTVRSGSTSVNVWLSPKMLDINRRVTVTVNGRSLSTKAPSATPNLQVLLEDARTRADRQHPFWAKVEMDTRRSNE